MKRLALLVYTLAISAALASCGSPAPQPTTGPGTAAPAATNVPAGPLSATPDLCSQANLRDSVKLVNNYMRQFSPYSSLALTVPQSQLPNVIKPLNAIRQATNDQAVPPCLATLKRDALLYMDTVIQTLLAFQAKPDLDTLNAGSKESLGYYNQYAEELANLLGVTLEPSATAGTPAASNPAETSTPVVVTILNPGPNALNIRVSPSLTAEAIGVLDAALSTTALGKSADGDWLLVALPEQTGKTGWVYASLVQVTSGDQGTLPVATP